MLESLATQEEHRLTMSSDMEVLSSLRSLRIDVKGFGGRDGCRLFRSATYCVMYSPNCGTTKQKKNCPSAMLQAFRHNFESKSSCC
eukprot:scaffold15066_cov120-Skeletonema_dohrnii-CCMP3373.AAC.1